MSEHRFEVERKYQARAFLSAIFFFMCAFTTITSKSWKKPGFMYFLNNNKNEPYQTQQHHIKKKMLYLRNVKLFYW